MSNKKLTLTKTQQQVYDLLHELLTVHGNVSITREAIAHKLNISISSVRRATDFITLNPLWKYGLDDIYSGYIGNFIYYSFNEYPEDIDEIDIHIIQRLVNDDGRIRIFSGQERVKAQNYGIH